MRLAKITTAFIALIMLVAFTGIAIKGAAEAKDINFNAPKLQSTEQKLKTINIKYERLNSQLYKKSSNDKQTIQQLKQEQEQLQQQKQNEVNDLQQKLQAKTDEKQKIALAAANAANELTATKKASAATVMPAAPKGVTVSGCGDNSYANYIYMHESGCRTAARNAGGCLGIGQACPASKLTSVCPNLDYACENAFFTRYAVDRYGSWSGAYNFWVNNHWW